MKRIFRKTLSLLLAAALLLTGGCGTFSLSDAERTELAEDEPQVVIGQSMGQALVATYAADHIFSLNSVSSSSYNPYVTTSAWNKVVGMLVYETLVTEDASFCARPNLITSWETEDGEHWIFTVDTSRAFHDGGSMTAIDAVYSMEQAMSYSSQYNTRFRNVRGVSSIDQSSFAVTLSSPNYRFYELMNIPCIEYGSGYDPTPPGTGPYMFSGSGRYLRLFKNHPHADEMPLESIHLKEYAAAVDILQAFEDSYLDLVINDPNGMSSLGYSSTNLTKYVDTTSLHYIGYNMYSPVFGQGMFRAAMTYAIDRNKIVSEAMKGAGVAATLPIHPNSPLYPEALAQTLTHSDSALETALANVGVRDLDGDGYAEFSGQRRTIGFIVCSDSAAKVAAARQITRDLRDVGIDVNLRELDYDEYLEALKGGSYDMYYAEVRLCADWDLSLLLGMSGSLNYGGIHDAALDGYIQTMLASTDETVEQNTLQLCQYIATNAPITTICFEKSAVLYHRGVITGLKPTQDNIFNDLQEWEIDLG